MATPLALIPAAMGGIKAISGAVQQRRGRKALQGLKDPGVVSQEERFAAAARRQRALGGLSTDKLAMQAIERNKANTMAALMRSGSAKGAQQGVLAAQGQATEAQRQEMAEQGVRKQTELTAAEAQSAALGAKEKKYESEQYQQQVAQAKENVRIGKQNVMAGLTDVAGAGMKIIGGQRVDEITGKGTGLGEGDVPKAGMGAVEGAMTAVEAFRKKEKEKNKKYKSLISTAYDPSRDASNPTLRYNK